MGRNRVQCFIKIESKLGFEMKFYTIEIVV